MLSRALTHALAAFGIATAGFAAGCVTTPGARPHEMSAAGHESVARAEEARAAQLAASPAPTTGDGRREAERHRRMAADHLAAAQALREAEAVACAGIAERARDASPLLRQDVEKVEPLREAPRRGPSSSYGPGSPGLAGGVVTLRAAPGVTAEWLQRAIDCHIARAALVRDDPAMADCPLALPGVTARVRSAGSRFLVEVRASEATAAGEVWRRARNLGPDS